MDSKLRLLNRKFMGSPRAPVIPRLRKALEVTGHRYTEQRAAVYGFLSGTTSHPNADEVFQEVRSQVPGISLATVYKSLETLVRCGLARKLTYADGSARYDPRVDPHHHARCLVCGRVMDVPGTLPREEVEELAAGLDGFHLGGYRLEFTGHCAGCSPKGEPEQAGTSKN
jgi:Fe2+ or Zn2+ uptake regulation protein